MKVPTFRQFCEARKNGGNDTAGASKPVFTGRPVTAKTLVDFTYDWMRTNEIGTTTFQDVSVYRYADTGEDVANDSCVISTFGADDLEITVNEANQQRGRRR